MEDQVKIAVLEQKIEDLKPIVLRIDAAIEKLSEVNIKTKELAVEKAKELLGEKYKSVYSL